MLVQLAALSVIGLIGIWMLFFGEYLQRPIVRWHDRLRGAAFVSPSLLRLSGRDYRLLIRFIGAILLVGFLALMFGFAQTHL